MTIFGCKEGAGHPWNDAAIEIGKISPLDTPNLIHTEENVLHDHVYFKIV